MLRPLLLLAIVLSLTGRLPGQPLPSAPTHWINYQQRYIKLSIAQPGLYRLTYTDLQRADFPVATIDPGTLQLFHRGVEQAISVTGEADGRFDPADYLEFYGRGNDGGPDSALYRPVSAQPHPYYSLFSDTTAYFLTARLDKQRGKRMRVYTDTAFGTLTPEAYHWAEDLRLFTTDYPGWAAGIPPKVEFSYFEAGEGYTGPILQKDQFNDAAFRLQRAWRTGPVPQLDLLLVGRAYTNHQVETWAGTRAATRHRIDSVRFTLYDNQRIERSLAWSDVAVDGNLLISTRSRGSGFSTDRYSWSYVRLRYPQQFSLAGQSMKQFQLAANPVGQSYVVLTDVPTNTQLFDLTDPTAPIRLAGKTRADSLRVLVPNTTVPRTVLAVSQVSAVPALRPLTFTSFANRQPTYLIVTHDALMKPAARQPMDDSSGSSPLDAVRAYATYRASVAGGSYDTLVVTVDQVFDQFNYGERSPLAIRRFAEFLLQNRPATLHPGDVTQPLFMLLLGRSRSTPGIRTHPQQALLDMVPTAGFPGSDMLFTAGLNGFPPDVPALPTGRINAGSPEEIMAYLNKVRTFEAGPPNARWRKNLLHLSGGHSADELTLFKSFVNTYKQQAEKGYLGATVQTLSKQTDDPVESVNVSGPVNAGLSLMTFFGHSGLNVTDLDIGFCSNEVLGYRNAGQYPFLLVNGCALGNFFYGAPTLGTDWVLTPNRGAIGVIAQSHLGYVDPLNHYTTQFYDLLADSIYMSKPIGVIQQETIRRTLAHSDTPQAIANAQQMVLQGDPAVVLFPQVHPDFAFDTSTVRISRQTGDSLTSPVDSVVITGAVLNLGRVTKQPVTIQVSQFTDTGQLVGQWHVTRPAPLHSDSLRLSFASAKAFRTAAYFKLQLDPNNLITELDEQNNTLDFNADEPTQALPFLPDQTPPRLEVAFDYVRIRDDAFVAARPRIQVLLQDENQRLLRTDTAGIDLYLQRLSSSSDPVPIWSEQMGPTERLSLNSPTVSWIPASGENRFVLTYVPQQNLPEGRYGLTVFGRDLSGNQAAPYRIHFRVNPRPTLTNSFAYPNPFRDGLTISFDLTGEQAPHMPTLILTNLNGQPVRHLTNRVHIGHNEWSWDGRSDAGGFLPNGVYIYQLAVQNQPVVSGRVFLAR